jgi:hypothetical protein
MQIKRFFRLPDGLLKGQNPKVKFHLLAASLLAYLTKNSDNNWLTRLHIWNLNE